MRRRAFLTIDDDVIHGQDPLLCCHAAAIDLASIGGVCVAPAKLLKSTSLFASHADMSRHSETQKPRAAGTLRSVTYWADLIADELIDDMRSITSLGKCTTAGCIVALSFLYIRRSRQEACMR